LQATAPQFGIKQMAVRGGFELRGPLRPIATNAKYQSSLEPDTCIPNGLLDPDCRAPGCVARGAESESDHWAIIAYGKVSIWLTTVKEYGQSENTKKISLAGPSRFFSNGRDFGKDLLTILLDPGGAQPG
jgi:hypothetical protein